MPPEYAFDIERMIHGLEERLFHQLNRGSITPFTKENLYEALEMWPVYQRDDIGERVVAIYRHRYEAVMLQDALDNHRMRIVYNDPPTAPTGYSLKERLQK